jgi:hypothetical protein
MSKCGSWSPSVLSLLCFNPFILHVGADANKPDETRLGEPYQSRTGRGKDGDFEVGDFNPVENKMMVATLCVLDGFRAAFDVGFALSGATTTSVPRV